MARVSANAAQQKGQQLQPGMASVMVNGKQVMVQGQTAMIQGQPTFIPSQTSILQGQTTVLPNGQTAIIQGGSFFLQGQPGQSLVAGQGQGQTVMIQQGQGTHQGTILSGRKTLYSLQMVNSRLGAAPSVSIHACAYDVCYNRTQKSDPWSYIASLFVSFFVFSIVFLLLLSIDCTLSPSTTSCSYRTVTPRTGPKPG